MFTSFTNSPNARLRQFAPTIKHTHAPITMATNDLETAYAHCDQLTRIHSKSFYLSTAFLPEAKRRAIRAVYAFCRSTDDIVDVPSASHLSAFIGNNVAASPAALLQEWRIASRQPSWQQTHPVLLAWATVREDYGVPQRYAEELVEGCEMDVTISRYETWDDLKRYCYHVASTVGLISAHIIGVNGDDPQLFIKSKPAAIELGVALQLTNILRDVGEDLARGRIYLPAEDMRRFNYTEDDLRNHVNDDRFKALMQFEIARAHALYEHSWGGVGYLQPDGRMAVGAAALLYRGILDRIVANDFDVFSQRARLSGRQKLLRLPSIYAKVRALPSLVK